MQFFFFLRFSNLFLLKHADYRVTGVFVPNLTKKIVNQGKTNLAKKFYFSIEDIDVSVRISLLIVFIIIFFYCCLYWFLKRLKSVSKKKKKCKLGLLQNRKNITQRFIIMICDFQFWVLFNSNKHFIRSAQILGFVIFLSAHWLGTIF